MITQVDVQLIWTQQTEKENKNYFAVRFIWLPSHKSTFGVQSLKEEWLTGIWDRWRSEKATGAGSGISPSCIIDTRSWLKMAPPYPSSAPLLSSVRWRLRSSCYCSNAWLIYHPWPERGATERGLIASCALSSQSKSISSVQLGRKSHMHVILKSALSVLVDLTSLNSFTVKVILYLQDLHYSM